MKKVLFFAAAAAMLAACSNTDELASFQNVQNDQEAPVNFEVYTNRATTRAGLPGNNSAEYGVTTATLKTGAHSAAGFGVFGYYTSNSIFDTNSSMPNFMYNQQVLWNNTKGAWTYEPVKYWPNEFGDAAISDDLDHVTFFAYAPWQKVTVNTGVPTTDIDAAFVTDAVSTLTDDDAICKILFGATDFATWKAAVLASAVAAYNAANSTTYADFAAWKASTVPADAAAAAAAETAVNAAPADAKAEYQKGIEDRMADQKLNITQLTKNNATGDPVIKYVVDMHPNTSVDLLWGVAAANGTEPYAYKGITDKNGNPSSTIKAGDTFVDLTKQGDVSGKVKWNFKHALARLNVQICTVVDKATPGEGTDAIGQEADGTKKETTRVWLRSVKFTNGFAQKGALNLHSEDVDPLETDNDKRVKAAQPNWLDFDGSSELVFEDVVLFDGLKDGKEGTANNVQKNETPLGINPILTQANPLYTGVPIKLTNLFEGSLKADDPIYVIADPNQTDPMEITVQYDIETADKRLAETLADGVTKGSAIENIITKSTELTILPGKAYTIKIYLGIESVKYDVEVTDWVEGADDTDVNLPKNE
jgi:hypothetical protein